MSSTEPTGAKPLSKPAVFVRRLGSFIVLWSIILGALFSGNKIVSDSVFLTIMLLLAGLGLA